MAQGYHLLQSKRSSFKAHRPFAKTSTNFSPMVSYSPQKQQKQCLNWRQSYSPLKSKAKDTPRIVKPQFNWCASKSVFVFCRKQLPKSSINFLRNKEMYRREMTEQVFCYKDDNSKPKYRNFVRSKSSKRRGQSERRVSTSQIDRKSLYIKPEPWQLKGENSDFQSLF